MKKYLFILILILVSYVGFAQRGISYQAVILDPNHIELPGQDITGQPLFKADVWVKFSIFSGSILVFEELHKTKTDEYGLVNLVIGSISTTSFNNLIWNSSQRNLIVNVSFNEGKTFTQVSDQIINYVPFAFFSDSAEFASTADKLKTTLGITGGGTGATSAVRARANLGLGNVDNTSDADKPISTATQAALDTIISAINNIIPKVTSTIEATSLPDASTTLKGKLKLAGDLAGTADAPAVANLAITTAKIAEGAVTLSKQANIATASFLGRNSAGSGSPEVLTPSIAKTLLALTKSDVGLENVDNTTDAAKPISTATQTALDLKANLVSPAFTGTPTAPTQTIGNNSTSIATTAFVDAAVVSATTPDATTTRMGKLKLAGDLAGTADAPAVANLAITTAKIAEGAVTLSKQANIATASFLGRNSAGSGSPEVLTPSIAKTLLALTKSDVGLENVDNTTDAAKPISTATQTALDLKANLVSPAFTGTPTAPTQTIGNNSTSIATTAYVDATSRTIFSTRVSLTSAENPAPIGSSLFNFYTITALAEPATFMSPTGTPLDGNNLTIKIKASGAEISLSWNSIYRGGRDISLPSITDKTMVLQFMYNANDAKWDLIAITRGI